MPMHEGSLSDSEVTLNFMSASIGNVIIVLLCSHFFCTNSCRSCSSCLTLWPEINSYQINADLYIEYVLISLWAIAIHIVQRIFYSEKIQPNLMPLKIISNGWVDLDSKIKFIICHWSWELGQIWHFQKKLGCLMNIHVW